MQIAVRQFKAQVSNYIALAQQGETIDITSHKRPVARMVGLPKTIDHAAETLLRHPAISWGASKPASSQPVTLSSGGVSVSELVLQDR